MSGNITIVTAAFFSALVILGLGVTIRPDSGPAVARVIRAFADVLRAFAEVVRATFRRRV